MSESGSATIQVKDNIGTLTFFHPKKNSLPSALLKQMAEAIHSMADDPNVNAIILRSEGEGTFCAGASFDELIAIETLEAGEAFFMGFANLILAMKACPKLIITRVHGKAVGGGVGLIAASDYVYALNTCSLRLSELAIGIGPFVVGPAIERKIGSGPFQMMTIDTEWRTAAWGEKYGLYSQTFSDIDTLDQSVNALAAKLAKSNPEAMAQLKSIFWEGTDQWSTLLPERAAMSGRLVLSEFTIKAISAFKSGGKK